MRLTVALLAVLLLTLGTAALAEPVGRARDVAPVTLEWAPTAFVYFESYDQYMVRCNNGDDDEDDNDEEGPAFNLDVEAGQTGAYDIQEMTVGANCPVAVTGILTPPPGAPGIWSWELISEDRHHGHSLHFGGPENGRGHHKVQVQVQVEGISIYDPAGHYPGGEMRVFVACDD